MEETQVILTFLLLKYLPTKWPINTIYRGVSAKKKNIYTEKTVCNQQHGRRQASSSKNVPEHLVIRSQSGVTSLRDKPAADD